jgi:isoleucyl-tRNA synthetase
VKLVSEAPKPALYSAWVPGIAVGIHPTEMHKCGRCWRYLPEVKGDGDLCDRCDEVVNG